MVIGRFPKIPGHGLCRPVRSGKADYKINCFLCFSENEMIRSDGIACQSRFCYRVVTLARLSYHINYITNPSNNSIYSPMASSISDTIIYSSAV